MKVVLLDESLRQDWDRVVHSSGEAWMFHLYDYMKEVSCGVWGYRSLSFLLEDEGRFIGIFPLFLRGHSVSRVLKVRLLFSGGWGTGGLALADGTSQAVREKAEKLAYDFADELAKKNKADALEVRLASLSPALLPPRSVRVNPLLEKGFEDNSSATYILDIANRSEEELFAGMETRCRTAIRKAEKKGVSVSRVDDPGGFAKEYYDLHCKTYSRTRAKTHPYSFFEKIFQGGWANIFAARAEGRTIAAVNVAAFKQGAFYWTSASDYEFHDLNANNLLQWQAIRWARESGCRWYEMGEVLLGATDAKSRGLYRFKSSFGGEVFPFFKGIKTYRPVRRDLINMVRKIRRNLT